MRRLKSHNPFTIKELFRILCFEYRIVSVDYFLDKMSRDECIWILQNLEYTDKNLWEASRFKVFSTIAMFSKNKPSLTDILRFPWESEEKQTDEPQQPGMTDEERRATEAYIISVLEKQNKE